MRVRSPDCDFHVFGVGQLPNGRPPGNLHYHGPYERFDDIETEAFDAFLYASRWDGLPNVLLEAAAHHLPIIAQVTGGIGEIVSEATGWPVPVTSDADDFSAILRQACFEFEQQCGPRPYRNDVRIDRDTPLFRDILPDAGNDIWQQGF